MKNQIINVVKMAAARLRDKYERGVTLRKLSEDTFCIGADEKPFIISGDEPSICLLVTGQDKNLIARFALGEDDLCAICVGDAINNWVALDCENHN